MEIAQERTGNLFLPCDHGSQKGIGLHCGSDPLRYQIWKVQLRTKKLCQTFSVLALTTITSGSIFCTLANKKPSSARSVPNTSTFIPPGCLATRSRRSNGNALSLGFVSAAKQTQKQSSHHTACLRKVAVGFEQLGMKVNGTDQISQVPRVLHNYQLDRMLV